MADAQQAVAQDLGEPSWAALVRSVEADVAAAVDELLELVAAGEHHAALTLARVHPRAAARLRSTSAAALIDAAREGRAGAVSTLLELGVDPNHRDPGSRATALQSPRPWAGPTSSTCWWAGCRSTLHARDAAGLTALGACVEGSARAPRERAGAHLVIAKVLASVSLRVDTGMPDRGSEEVGEWLAAQPARRPLGQEHGEAAWSAAVAVGAHVARSPLAERRPAGDGLAFRTGLLDNTRNGVVCSRLPADAADAAIEELVSWFAEHRAPAQWLIAAQTEPPDLGRRLEDAGCRPERAAVFMAADLAHRDLADPRLPAGVEIEPLRDAAALAAAFAGAEALDDDPEQHYAARLPEGPVGIVSSLTAQPGFALERFPPGRSFYLP